MQIRYIVGLRKPGDETRAKNKLYLIITLVTLQVMVFVSCKKFVTINPPKNQIVSETVYSNDATATSVIRGIYSQMVSSNGFASGNLSGVTFLAGFSSDELTCYSTNSDIMAFFTNSLVATNSNNLWDEPYVYINNANAVIEGLNNSTGVTVSTKNELLGEAKFIRAFCNFYLVNLYGDVPLITSTDYLVNAVASRTSKIRVYQQIINDLSDAQNLLATDFSFSNGERDQPNKWAATALLARTYLYTGDWINADAQATALINNTAQYSLVNTLNDVFLKNSSEAIWQLQPTSATTNTNEGFNFILTGVPGYAALSNQVVNAFEPGDNRKAYWVDSITVGPDTYYYPFKYKIKSSSVLIEYSMVLRLSEQYLIRAEAKAQEGDITGGQADLNAIRNRAGLGNTDASDKPSLLRAILNERRVELFTEWGHRWLDLKRTGDIDSVMNIAAQIKGSTWNTNSQLYPIPQSEIINDVNLMQNPGY